MQPWGLLDEFPPLVITVSNRDWDNPVFFGFFKLGYRSDLSHLEAVNTK